MLPPDALAALRDDPRRARGFTCWRELPPEPACLADWPAGVGEPLRRALAARGIERPYTHQATAIAAVLAGRDVVVATPTASGKSLCYQAPVAQAVLDDPASRALFLFPTKALAQDQLAELQAIVDALGSALRAFTYDGDTPADARRAVRQAGHVVITNPDMLHTGILPHHTKWLSLFENLRYVVVDELHQYRGVFGSHVANVLRRLLRVARFYGSEPVFICSSATIGNPGDLAERLLGRPVQVVEESGAPRGPRTVAVYNPPVVNRELGIRRSPLHAARRLTRDLSGAGAQVLCFAQSRQEVELLVTYLRRGERARPSAAGSAIEGYRAGYLPKERRAIERDLRNGRLRTVVATNALELGIDVGSMDAVVCCRYPGSVSGTWQRFGRAGRRQGASLAVLVAGSGPLDQYVATHPDFLFERPAEAGRIDPDNLEILVEHVKCAAFELPFRDGEQLGPAVAHICAALAEAGILVRRGDRYFWSAESFPAEGVSLRSASTQNVVIIDHGPPARVIGEVDRASAPLLVHEDAIYYHGGRQYHVDRLAWDELKAYVHPVEVDHYTDAQLAVDLRVLHEDGRAESAACEHAHGGVTVTYLATIFKKVRLFTHENVGWGTIALPQDEMQTRAYWLALPSAATAEMTRAEIEAGLLGLANVLVNVAPVFLLCDARDLQTSVQVRSPFTELPTVFLYEAYPGGVGLAERCFEVRAALLEAAHELLRDCGCRDGCPGCVGPPPRAEADARAAALRIVAALRTFGA